MTEQTSPFDVADYLDTPEVAVAYIAEVLTECDPGALSTAVGDVARAIPLWGTHG